MKKISCRSVSTENCNYNVYGENINDLHLNFLIHYNEDHDPSFVAKCNDDLKIEYKSFVEKISLLLG